VIKKYAGSAIRIFVLAIFAFALCSFSVTDARAFGINANPDHSETAYGVEAASGDAGLKAITVSSGTLSPAFDPDVLNYTLSVKESVSKVTVKASAADIKASVSPAKKTYTLKSGQTITACITVKAPSGTAKVYRVAITRAKSTNANLKSLKTSSSACPLKPSFKPGITNYSIVLPANKGSLTVSAIRADKLSKVSVQTVKGGAAQNTGKVVLDKGQSAAVIVTVTAQAGNKKVYTIHVNRLFGKWDLIWNDEFDGTGVDTSKWTALEEKDGGFKSLQYYRPENVTVSGGKLTITARKEKYKGKSYTSGFVETSGKFNYKYGKIEARIKIPAGYGFFPAFWLWQENHKKPYQEIDIMENIGRYKTTIYSCHHYTAGKRITHDYGKIKIKNANAFHTYTLVWTEKELKSYVDGKLYFKTKKKIPKESMYIILNLAVGGVWPHSPKKSTKFPSSFIIDYVRVYKYI